MGRLTRAIKHPDSVCAYITRKLRCKKEERLCSQPDGYKRLWTKADSAAFADDLALSAEVVRNAARAIAPAIRGLLLSAYPAPDFEERVRAHAVHLLDGETYVLCQYRRLNPYDCGAFWHTDYTTDYCFLSAHHSVVRRVNVPDDGTDIKRVWEVARMQYLLAPALRYFLARDERCAHIVVRHMESFIRYVPYDYDVLWQPSMEVGIRLANMILAFCLVADSPACADDFVAKMQLCAAQHVRHLQQFPENLGGRSSNHHLGALLGKAAYTIAFAANPRAMASDVLAELEAEAQRQLLDCGADYEGSLPYHRLVGELLSLSFSLLSLTGAYAGRSVCARLAKAVAYAQRMSCSDSQFFQLGDNDSGRALCLYPDEPNSQRVFWNMAQHVIEACSFTMEDFDLSGYGEPLYSNGKIASIRTSRVHVVLNAFDCQMYGMGDHAHNDLLSFVMAVDGEPVIIDPGTGSYTGDPQLRNALRSVAAHSTVRMDGREQRRMRASTVFGWASDVDTVSLRALPEHEGRIVKGELTYEYEGSTIRHTRVVRVRELDSRTVVEITDSVEGPFRILDMTLPFAPTCTVETEKRTALIRLGLTNIRIEGTWLLDVADSLFSPCYDSVEPNQCIVARSPERQNTLTITVCHEGI